MLWKSEKNTYDTLFDATETKYLGSGNKSRIYDRLLEFKK